MKQILLYTSILFMSISTVACSTCDKNKGPRAKAKLEAKSGSKVSGKVKFKQKDGYVKVYAKVKGLKPGAKHGFHIHEKGDCSAADGSSAGGHFMLGKQKHGAPHDMSSHVGDMGNLEANKKGEAKLKLKLKKASLDPNNEAYIVGRAVIVHKGTDDLKTQPTGAAGARIACGLIKLKD
tara:strand:- start:3270 stop:3806 length:537 start_codon:yes stop_codon:yes gene_type:complete